MICMRDDLCEMMCVRCMCVMSGVRDDLCEMIEMSVRMICACEMSVR